MKYIRIITNWLFVFTVFPIFLLFFTGSLFVACGQAVYKIWYEGMSNLANMFNPATYLNGRRPWLIDGELWPLQNRTREHRARFSRYKQERERRRLEERERREKEDELFCGE